jgi:DNA repair ATPase RecN
MFWTEAKRVATRVSELATANRREEIARMLALKSPKRRVPRPSA